MTADPPGAVAVSIEHYLWFVDQALDDMAAIVRELGDEVANRRPAFEGANSPYVILTHCLGVLAFWGGATVAERDVTRDRAAEFTAHGSVEDLVARSRCRPARGWRRTWWDSKPAPFRPTCRPMRMTCPTPRPRGPCSCTF